MSKTEIYVPEEIKLVGTLIYSFVCTPSIYKDLDEVGIKLFGSMETRKAQISSWTISVPTDFLVAPCASSINLSDNFYKVFLKHIEEELGLLRSKVLLNKVSIGGITVEAGNLKLIAHVNH